MPKLVFHDSDGIDKTIPLGTAEVTIGRASDCEIQTHDAMVSRKHARITWDGSYWIEDLGSSNGVFLGADKVQRAPFRPGDVVTCGSLVVRMLPDARRPASSSELPDSPRPSTPRGIESAPEMPRNRRTEQQPNQNEPYEEEMRTTASPALAGGGEQIKLKADLRREQERREQAEAALLSAEEKAAGADVAARELIQLRRRVEQLQSDLRRARDEGENGGGDAGQAAHNLEEVAEAAALFNDALAELKASLRAAVDEAELLTSPTPSVRVVRESMRSAMDELERARERLRDMVRKLGLRKG